MDHQQAVTSMSKYVAQAKEVLESYITEFENECSSDCDLVKEALILLNQALDNVIV